MKNDLKEYLSTVEAAKYMRISRVAVLKKIKNGQLPASRVGRSFAIARGDLHAIIGSALTSVQKEDIKKVVKRATKEYGATFERLSKE